MLPHNSNTISGIILLPLLPYPSWNRCGKLCRWLHHQSINGCAAPVASQVQAGCEALVQAARQRWFDTKQGYVDDITAVVVALGDEEP